MTYLFVPGVSVDRIPKALASGADRVVLDLEDGVRAEDKERARDLLAELELSVPVICRVNPRTSEHHEADLNMVRKLTFVEGIMLPKTERADDIQALRNYLPSHVQLLALVESALGILNAPRIAAVRPDRLVLGSADYLTDIGVPSSPEALATPRTALVLASAASGLPSPVDGPTLAVKAEEVVHQDTEQGRALGMGAKLCIHPSPGSYRQPDPRDHRRGAPLGADRP